jgi:hypothetical protein
MSVRARLVTMASVILLALATLFAVDATAAMASSTAAVVDAHSHSHP